MPPGFLITVETNKQTLMLRERYIVLIKKSTSNYLRSLFSIAAFAKTHRTLENLPRMQAAWLTEPSPELSAAENSLKYITHTKHIGFSVPLTVVWGVLLQIEHSFIQKFSCRAISPQE
jgi:hypothetical protein